MSGILDLIHTGDDARLTDQLGLPAPYNEGPGDALRHAYAAALATQRGGRSVAEGLGDLNELAEKGGRWLNSEKARIRGGYDDYNSESSRYATDMDYKNHHLGYEIGELTDNPKDALLMILSQMLESTGQDTKWGEGLEDVTYDDQFPAVWNRQHYDETPDEVESILQHLISKISDAD